MQPVASGSGERANEASEERTGARRQADTGERRRRASGAAHAATGPGGRRAARLPGDTTGGQTGPRRRAGRDAAPSGPYEPADQLDPASVDLDDELGPDDRLAWLRQGWIGPLAVALVVALLAVGGYVVLRGDGGSGGTAAGPSASAAPVVPTNPDALTGKAMIDGDWQCRLVTGTTPLKLSDTVVGVLRVERTAGAYSWGGQAGQYTITAVSGNDGANVIGEVKFTSGPLKDLQATHIAKPGGGIGGRAQGTLDLKASGSAPHRFCGVN
ncbi:hypothetical protein [Frankia sp. AiPa1]|uniref:hypothetical protein n=1 Tax=Frankia sp. AiPa1 TaxID=573492 RepID=UPI00202B7EE4|nr:hypothetical protein [Frankia sp. AiPa1]